MKAAFRALLALAAGVAAAPSCSAPPLGELMLVVQTDMSLPKDIDTIRVEVLIYGAPKYAQDFEGLGDPSAAIRLPATLGLLPPEDPSAPVTIRVSARRGGPGGEVRVLREVVTTIPSDRVAMLPIPLQFLCDGSGEVKNGRVETTCPNPNETCIAGTCAPREVDSTKLPMFAPEQIFGGGTGKGDGSCFDVQACFMNAALAAVEPEPCALMPSESGAENVALRTENDGMCGAAGCFIPLDAESPIGFMTDPDGKRKLPPAVCDQIMSGKLLGVVTAPVTDVCQQKTVSLPPCGPWSSAGLSSVSGDSAALKPLWRSVAPMAKARFGPSAVLLNNGKVLVAGGWDFDFITFLSSAELYDPKSDIWSPAASMSTARGRPTLVVLPNGKVLAIGGDGPAVLNTVEIYDPDTNMWTAAASMGTARYGFGAVLLPDGKVLVMAGVGESGQPLDDVEIYYPDPPEGGPGGVWAQPGVTTAVKGTVTAVLLQNGSVFVAAESLDEPPAFTHAVYDLGSGTWTVTAPSLYPHSNFNATLLPSGMVLVTSGEGSELYDPKKDTWTPTSPPTGVGFYHTATLLDTGEVLVSVGNDGDAPAMLYNPSTNAWIVAGWPIHPRLLPTATRLLDGRVLMAGGAYNPDGTGGPDPVELFECAKPAECGLLP